MLSLENLSDTISPYKDSHGTKLFINVLRHNYIDLYGEKLPPSMCKSSSCFEYSLSLFCSRFSNKEGAGFEKKRKSI